MPPPRRAAALDVNPRTVLRGRRQVVTAGRAVTLARPRLIALAGFQTLDGADHGRRRRLADELGRQPVVSTVSPETVRQRRKTTS